MNTHETIPAFPRFPKLLGQNQIEDTGSITYAAYRVTGNRSRQAAYMFAIVSGTDAVSMVKRSDVPNRLGFCRIA